MVSIDEEKISVDAQWDGLKSYVTNTDLPAEEVITQYHGLWVVERAFRITKGSLEARTIFNRKSKKEGARLNLARWYNRVSESGFHSFNTIAATIYEHHDEILNYFDHFSTNASAESINSKIKAFRAKLHGVTDRKFFIFRLCKIYA